MINKIIQEDLLEIYNSDIDWDRFSNKTILITGANGFLPAYIVQSLLFANKENPSLNIRVIALVRSWENAVKRFGDEKNNKHLTFIVTDVCEKITYDGKIDFIIHAASQASPKYYGTDPVGTISANVTGTINMLELAKKHQIESFLYFSSSEVYGQVDSEHNPIKEDYFGYLNPMSVRACYGESKKMGENICVSYYHQYQIPVKIVRPFHTYGPGMQLNDGRVYADFISNILKDEDIHLKSDGLAQRAFCYLTDATIGFLKVLLSKESGQAYNVGNPFEEYSILELAEIVSKVGKKPVNVVKMHTNDGIHYMKSPVSRNAPDISKMITLGWKPATSVARGFERTYFSYL